MKQAIKAISAPCLRNESLSSFRWLIMPFVEFGKLLEKNAVLFIKMKISVTILLKYVECPKLLACIQIFIYFYLKTNCLSFVWARESRKILLYLELFMVVLG